MAYLGGMGDWEKTFHWFENIVEEYENFEKKEDYRGCGATPTVALWPGRSLAANSSGRLNIRL